MSNRGNNVRVHIPYRLQFKMCHVRTGCTVYSAQYSFVIYLEFPLSGVIFRNKGGGGTFYT